MLYTLQDVAKGNLKEAFVTNADRRNRTLYATADAILMFMLFGILKGVYDSYIKDNGDEGIDGNIVKFMANVNMKVLNESNL
jgi:hypothetical protein